MRWVVLCAWLAATVWAGRRRSRAFAWALCAGLAGGMGMQLAALAADGLLTLQTALPLHLCSFSAVVAIPALLLRARAACAWLWLLGAPCALLALLFPAVLRTSRPVLTELGFYQLHAALLCAPLYLRLAWRAPPPADPRGALLGGLALMAGVAAFDRWTGCNYLFLLRAPPGTPLAALAANGPAQYAASLAMAGMALTAALAAAWAPRGRRAGK